MTQESNIIEGEMNTIESASPSPAMVKETFSAWLYDGHAKKYAPAVYLSCMDKVSAYLIRRKISIDDLWQLTNFNLFKSIYDIAINDKLFRAMDKKTHATFVQVGQAFLKFLKSKPILHEAPAVALESPSQPGSRLTIKEAIIRVLENEQHGLTPKQIYSKIVENRLYSFGAKNPKAIVCDEISRACENSNRTVRASKNYFRFEINSDGKKVYFLLDSNNASAPEHVASDNSEETVQTSQPSNDHCAIEIWNDSIEHHFQTWMESENYASDTVRNYCRAMNRTVKKFKPLADVAISESSTALEAVRIFVNLLNQDNEFVAANNTAHNQFSAALSALVRFIVSTGDANNTGLPVQPSSFSERTSVSGLLVRVFKETFPNGIGIGFVDFTRLKASYEEEYGEPLDVSDEQIKQVIVNNSIRLNGNATRYIHLDNLATTEVLNEIEQYLDEQFESGTERVYIEPLYSMFRDKMGIMMNSDLLMQVIETKYGTKYKTNKKSSFVQLVTNLPTTNIWQEIEQNVTLFLSQDIVPYTADEIAEKLPHYPRAKVERTLETSAIIIKTADGKYSHVDYVYIDENECGKVKDIIAEGVSAEGYKTLDSLYSEIGESIPSIIENNEGIGEQNILKAIKYQVRDVYRVMNKRLADQYCQVEAFEPLRKEGR